MPTTVTGTETTITGLTAGTLYRFRARARNANGYGPYSAWSEPGTPTSGPPAPPPSLALNVSVSALFGQCGTNWCSGVAAATVSASSGGLLSNIVYNWEGRLLRERDTTAPPGQVRFVVSNPTGDWASVAPYADAGFQDRVKAYWVESGAFGDGRRLFFRAVLAAPPAHYWELRCRVTASVIVSGSPVAASGTSRTIAFKEMWNGVDYPTSVSSQL